MVQLSVHSRIPVLESLSYNASAIKDFVVF